MTQRDEWGAAVPDPMHVFNHRTISPRNIEIETRKAESKILPDRTVRGLVKRRDQLKALLNSVNFWQALDEFQAQATMKAHLNEARIGVTPEERAEIDGQIRAVEKVQARLRAEHAAHIDAWKEYKQIVDRLNDHSYAVQRQKVKDDLNKQLAAEASYFEEIIVRTWARLGYKHERLTGRGKREVDMVRIAETHIVGGSQIWLKIETTRKTMGRNFKSVLPYGVRVRDLVSEETCYELTTAAQRQITSVTNNNGAWIIVNRLNTVDGIKTYVTYADIMAAYRESDRMYLPIPMGVGERDEISWLHLAQYPHFLVAGTTGGGKSNMINVIITTLISKHGPNEVQFVLVDLKEGLEFQHYDKIPHLMRPVVTSIDGAAEVMLQLEQKRAERGKLLAAARVKDIDEYNQVMERRKQPQMPRIVVIFDEYAAIDNPFSQDLKKSIQASAMQLTNKARAAGIHLILCTQRPSVDVVPGHIKDNMAFRIAGAMPTQAASTTILGVGDAATLPLIKGRMIAMAGSLKWQIQTPHIKQADIENGVRIAKKWAEKLTAIEMEKETLPEAKGSLGFGEDDLIHLVMDDYGGQLIFTELWNQLKDTQLVSHNDLHKMCKKLKLETQFEYEGVMYRWVTQQGGHVLATPIKQLEASA
jgi:hypothetical protein